MDDFLRDEGFEPLKKLGSGGFGEVWLAIDEEGNQVAVKCLTNVEGDSLVRFRREVGVVAAHDANPHVVSIYRHSLDSETPFYVMEYCARGSLYGWIADRRRWDEIALALVHVLEGLKDLHSRGGFHRDIKPHNLLLCIESGELHVKVADFGLARDPDRNSSMTAFPGGTRGYQAPEVLGTADHTAKADIYSLGITALELLTGTRDLRELKKVDCPVKLRSLVKAMISPDPDDRPSPQSALKELSALLVPKDVAREAREKKSLEEGSRAIQQFFALSRDDGRFALGGLLVAAAVAILALIILKPKRPG